MASRSSSAAALQAATQSFNNNLKSQQRQRSAPPLSRSTCATTHLTARDRDFLQPRSSSGSPRSNSPAQHRQDRDLISHNRGSPRSSIHPTHPQSPSFIAANMAWPSPKTPNRTADLHQDGEEVLPPRGLVKDAKRQLLQQRDSDAAGSVPLRPIIPQRHTVPNAVDISPIEDTSSLITMFGGRPREVGGIGSVGGSSTVSVSSNSTIRKTPSRPLKKNSTGPGPSSANANILAPKPIWTGSGENPSATVVKLTSQLPSLGSGLAQSNVSQGRNGGNVPKEDSGLHQIDVDGTRTITLPLVHPMLQNKRSGISTTPKRVSQQADVISEKRLSLPQQVQEPPPLAPTREALSNNKPMSAGSGSGNSIYTDAPEQPIPRAAPAPPAPRRNRGPRRHAPTQAPKERTLPSIPQPPVPRSGRDSVPTVAVRKTETPSVPPTTPSRQPTARSTTSSGPLLVAGNPLSRNPSGSSSTSLTAATANASTHNHALLASSIASSIASSRTPPVPPAQPPVNFPPLQRKPKKKPVVPPPLRRRRSEPSIGAHIGGGGIRTTMRAPAPPPKPKPPGTVPRLLPTHKHKHKHSASLHPLHLSDTIISEKERKRYEGVWAANSGHLMDTLVHLLSVPPPPLPPLEQQQQQHTRDIMLSEGIHPFVAKDIWTRSRLPPDMLSQIWKLVDRGAKGWLCREEFVIGMWLIDRCLRGKKLPMGGSLADAVWASVRRLGI